MIKNGTYGGRGSSSIEALESFLEPRRGRMFIVSRPLRYEPRRGGMSCALKAYAAPNVARKSAAAFTINIAPLRGLPGGTLDRRFRSAVTQVPFLIAPKED